MANKSSDFNDKIQFPLLDASDIEVKIKQVTKSGALALLYKTARTDRKYLNLVYGPLNWTSDYKVVNDNLYCGIGVRNSPEQPFVWKWDCGIESRADDEGNEKKGEASDAFKRAGFQWGIGEELYSAPFIFLSVNTEQKGDKWKLSDPFAKYEVSAIEYDEKERKIIYLAIINNKGVQVFEWADPNYESKKAKKSAVKSKKEELPSDNAKTAPEASKTATKPIVEPIPAPVTEKIGLKTLITDIGRKAKAMLDADGNMDKYNQILVEVTGDSSFKCSRATEDQYDIVKAIHEKLQALK